MRPSTRQQAILAAGLGLLASLLSAPAAAEVRGRVTGASGVPVENARVTAPDGETHFSDVQGLFTFASLQPPVELTVSHARFLDARVQIDDAEVAEIRLQPKQEIFQEIAVSATRGESLYAPSSSSASVLDVRRLTTPVATLTDVVATAPGVAENGQGGIFQTYSIRGVARQRVLTLLSGMRIIGERRAGVSASFIDPGLMGKVDVLRGPASTYYGSGALGGVIQLFPRTFQETVVETGYESNGDGLRQLVGWGDGEGWSLGLAHRSSQNGETAGVLELNDRFDQTSAVLGRTWRQGLREYSVQAIASRGTDIGKSNTDYPTRVTDYPGENHLLLRFALRGDAGWGFGR
jgi:outer membrane receptor protein involved in Fe transport